MRISTPYKFDTYNANIRLTSERYFEVQRQLSTGKRWQNASEDPMSATLSMDARRIKTRLEQFDNNIRSAKDYLGNSENSLTEVTSLMRQAYSLAVQGASDSVTPQSREALANQIVEMQKRLTSLGNWQGSSGQYLFAGQMTDTKPFVENGGALTFNGDTGAIRAEVRTNELVEANVAGAGQMFVDMYASLESLKNNLRSGDVVNLSGTNIPELQSHIDSVAKVRGDLGNKMQTVEAYASENLRRKDDLTGKISELEETDFAEAMIRLQESQNAYQAALQVASQGMSMSLMDFIR